MMPIGIYGFLPFVLKMEKICCFFATDFWWIFVDLVLQKIKNSSTEKWVKLAVQESNEYIMKCEFLQKQKVRSHISPYS